MRIKWIEFPLIVILFNGLSASAQTWLWGNEGISGLKAGVYSSNVATNKTGNVYQAGEFITSLMLGSYTLNSGAEEDVYIVKYDQNGNLLWANQSVGTTTCYAVSYSIASDDSDNAYITGFAQSLTVGGFDTLSFGTHKLFVTNSGQFFVVKYNSAGNIRWAIQSDTSSLYPGTEAWGIASDKFGHEYVTGDGAYLIKYDRNGKMIWSVPQINSLYGVSSDIGYSVATDASGNVYMAGIFSDSLQFGTIILYNINTGIFIAKFDSNGNALWAQQSTGFYLSSVNNYNVAVAVDKAGAAYLTSTLNADSISLGPYGFSNYTTSSFFVAKFNPSGSIAWAESATPSATTSCGSNSIAADDSNHIYIVGNEQDAQLIEASFSMSNYTVSVVDTLGIDVPTFIIKLDSSGKMICGSTLASGGTMPNAVASDSSGRYIYTGGMFLESFDIGDSGLNDNTGGYNTYVGRWLACGECNLPVNISPHSPSVCNGQSVALTAYGGSNYTWSPSTDLNSSTGDSVVATPTTTTTYTISSSINNCSDTGKIVVTVVPASPLNIFPPSPTICRNLSDTLYVKSQGSDFTWSPSLGLNTTTGESIIAGPTATVTYTVTGIDSLGCEATGTVTVNIIPIPNKPSFTQHNDTLISSAKYDNQWYLNNTLLLDDTSQYLIITTTGNYYVEVNNEANGCSTSSDTTNITSLTGINQLSARQLAGQLLVYPNPFNNDIVVTISSSAQDVKGWSLQIIDVLGQTVYSRQSLNYNNDIDLSNLPGGVYFITVINKTGRTVVPVVKQ